MVIWSYMLWQNIMVRNVWLKNVFIFILRWQRGKGEGQHISENVPPVTYLCS